MREYDLVVQEVSLLVQTDYLTAVAEAWVNRHCPLLAYRSGKQKLREILSENVNRLDVSLFLGLFDNLVGQRWLKQTLISVINGLTDLVGKLGTRITMFLTKIIIDLVAAFLRVRIEPYRQKALILSTKYRQKVMRRNPLERHREIEISPILRSLGIA